MPDKHDRRFPDVAAAGITLNAGRRGLQRNKRHALATRMVGRADDYPRFAPDLRIPSANNEAEQVIRMSKLDQSLQLHALRPLAEVFCAIRSYLATGSRHG